MMNSCVSSNSNVISRFLSKTHNVSPGKGSAIGFREAGVIRKNIFLRCVALNALEVNFVIAFF